MAQQSLTIQLNPLLRIAGDAAPVAHIVHQALATGTEHVRARAGTHIGTEATQPDAIQLDPTLIDLTLHVDDGGGTETPPRLGVGYAGLSPRQRYEFLTWASNDPTQPAPPAYQQLYCAHLEVRLLGGDALAAQARELLPRLWQSPAWLRSPALGRVQLLAFWLDQDGAGLAAWIGLNLLPAELAGIALGCQALLGQPLDARELVTLSTLWPIQPPHAAPVEDPIGVDVLRLHLSSLEASLGERLLHHALQQLPEHVTAPQPWRASHRGLRLEFPQPDLRAPLLPLLRDLYSLPATESGSATITEAASAATPGNVAATAAASTSTSAPRHIPPVASESALPERGWQLILEFGNSRSEYFEVVMRNAQKLPGYAQLMDENRQLVHRVIFKRSELRRFWRIWDYVQSWSSTRVYFNGAELEKWKIWPYSQYLQ
ncbi:MAG: hypothetical protein WDZ49_00875 [Litorilinea sp.]